MPSNRLLPSVLLAEDYGRRGAVDRPNFLAMLRPKNGWSLLPTYRLRKLIDTAAGDAIPSRLVYETVLRSGDKQRRA